MAAYGLYTHIAANKTRSLLLLGGLFLLIYVLVFAGAIVIEVFLDSDRTVTYYLTTAWNDMVRSIPAATVISALWIVIAYFFHQNIIDAVTGGHSVTRKEQPRLYNLLENLCISRGIPMPKLKVMETPALNAFATGLNQRQYAITVTTGLINGLNDREMEAVLGHELTHIRNGDVQMMVIAVIIAGVVGFFAEMLFRLFGNARWSSGGSSSSSSSRSSSSSSDSKSSGGGAFGAILIAVVMLIVAWFLSQVVRFALSRSRELLADAGSVELTKDPDAMISALRKIENRGELEGATSSVMEMCIDNPRQGFADLFATHPSIDERIAALVKFAGGHDPGYQDELPPPEDKPAIADASQDDSGGKISESAGIDQGTPHSGPWSDGDAAPVPTRARGRDTMLGKLIPPLGGPWGPRGRR